MKKIILFFAIVISTIAVASAQQYQEVVYLKNGSVIKGVILEQVPSVSYKIKTPDGSLIICEWDDVSKITKEIAQEPQREVKTYSELYDVEKRDGVKYQGEVLVGYGAGVGDEVGDYSSVYAIDRVNIHTIQGVRFNKYLSAGIGAGFNVIQSYGYDETTEVYMPIYLDVKGYLPVSNKVSLFASVDIGNSYGITEELSDVDGLLFCPAVGVNINNRLNISLGYEGQNMTIYESYYEQSIEMDAVTIKIGFVF